MEICIWKALGMVKDRASKQGITPRKERGNRRTNRQDRRHSVSDGLCVSLSTREEKRKNPDRRRQTADGELPQFFVERGTLFDENSV